MKLQYLEQYKLISGILNTILFFDSYIKILSYKDVSNFGEFKVTYEGLCAGVINLFKYNICL